MASIMDLISQQLSGGGLSQISKTIGADEATTGRAVTAALPTLLAGLAKNTSQPAGAQSLLGALQRDHDGGILGNLGGLLTGAKTAEGDAILGHIFGTKRNRIEQGLGHTTQLDAGSMGKLLAMLAPMVMGALGKATREKNLDAQGLSGMLHEERTSVQNRMPSEMGMLGQLLDADGDGDIDLKDIAGRGKQLFGGLFS